MKIDIGPAKAKIWVKRSAQWVPTVTTGPGQIKYLALTNIVHTEVILHKGIQLGWCMAEKMMPRSRGYVSVGSRRYNDWQTLVLEATTDREEEGPEEYTKPLVDHPAYTTPKRILTRLTKNVSAGSVRSADLLGGYGTTTKNASAGPGRSTDSVGGVYPAGGFSSSKVVKDGVCKENVNHVTQEVERPQSTKVSLVIRVITRGQKTDQDDDDGITSNSKTEEIPSDDDMPTETMQDQAVLEEVEDHVIINVVEDHVDTEESKIT